ncbi:4'-phosphopantetheinyl transferase superfamily protein [Marinomonas sp. RSW2]|uniref:4'-phosphopantetheinyl transferase superfamily protein n=1 Tax=Marinomonas maritima TaxID=2940935 RepID=A0ABT5WA45_9GAMM|nr:4'-phosphopantetheinyl transferase superfamily protein [Marinomonas maritima]MDE8601691.1 4'-phosphopantetheinyl transferase superfamily protein [Marinomonas maritima]
MQRDIRVFFANTETLSNEQQQHLFDRLPDTQKNKVLGLKSKKKKREFVVGRTLLIHALQSEKNLQSLPLILEEPFAAPKVDSLDNCYVSISHSGCLVCCVLHTDPVGIDIEHKKNRKDLIHKSDFFMHHDELETLKTIVRDDRKTHYFYEVWCTKEAFFKALDSDRQKQTSLKSIQLSLCFKGGEWSVFQSDMDNHHLSLVYRGEERQVQLMAVDLSNCWQTSSL